MRKKSEYNILSFRNFISWSLGTKTKVDRFEGSFFFFNPRCKFFSLTTSCWAILTGRNSANSALWFTFSRQLIGRSLRSFTVEPEFYCWSSYNLIVLVYSLLHQSKVSHGWKKVVSSRSSNCSFKFVKITPWLISYTRRITMANLMHYDRLNKQK